MPDFDYKCRHSEKRRSRGKSSFLAFIYYILLVGRCTRQKILNHSIGGLPIAADIL